MLTRAMVWPVGCYVAKESKRATTETRGKEHSAKNRAEIEKRNVLRWQKIHTETKSTWMHNDDVAKSSVEQDVDDLYVPGKSSLKQSTTISPENQEKHSMKTRSNIHSVVIDDIKEQFPQIPVWTGYKTFNIDIIEALAVMVDGRKTPSLVRYIGNKVLKVSVTL